jgi:non-heme chloroperoxidase
VSTLLLSVPLIVGECHAPFSSRLASAFSRVLVFLLVAAAAISGSNIKHVHANGVDLAYVEKGRGTPILLVHGSLGDFNMWSGQMDTLARNHRVIALSRRYHWPNVLKEEPKDYTPQLHAQDVAAFIQALGLAPVHLVGHSYGGFICAYVAKDHPELVRSLTLIEPPIFSLLSSHPGHPPFATTALKLFAKGEDDSAVKSFISGVNGPGSFERLPPKIQEHMLLNAHEMRAELRMPPERFFPVFTCDDARRITMPVLLVTGTNSPKFFRAILNQLRVCVPSSSEAEIPAASHGVQYENPEAFNDALVKFVVQVEKVSPLRKKDRQNMKKIAPK